MSHLQEPLAIAGATAASFLDGTRAFNALSLLMSILGCLLGLAGVFIAVVQVSAAKRAAEQARDATRETAARFTALQAAVELSRVAAEARAILLHLRSDNFVAAADSAFRVRESAAYARFHGEGRRLLSAHDWQKVMDRVGRLHELVEQLARTARRTRADEAVSLELAGTVIELFNGLAGSAAEQTLPSQE